MAAIRFPKVPHFKDPTEPQINVCDHLTVVKIGKLELSNGELNVKGVFFDSTMDKLFLLESGIKSSLISTFSQSGEFLHRSANVGMKNPCGIAVDGDNLYVTDIELHCIFHFEMPYFQLVTIIGKKGTGDKEFKFPYQLAVSLHGDIFVTDCMNDRIKIINRFLKYKNHISHHSIRRPCDVKLTPVCVYVLSSRGYACVHVFSYTGEKIRSLITGRGIGKQVVSPQFFCLDADENLFISDRSCADQLCIFSKEGTLLHTMGESGYGVGELKLIQGIALINNHKIAVACQENNYGLQIFSYL